ncbi:MAG: universal stress protein [Acidimicrobiia bacterium]|nr:universal stress protein [Acidimicrobiia bacterium]MYB78612.1 universal stress protein [Acidimicrobiia bacterium]MYD41132.1 universal stress protein [Acidimicrobiia bacterium]MYK55755.1 universal stress protein [Acidimicrobiia bacterium]
MESWVIQDVVIPFQVSPDAEPTKAKALGIFQVTLFTSWFSSIPCILADMRILVCTSGVLQAPPVIEFCAPLVGHSGRVVIMTVVQVPQSLLGQFQRQPRSFLSEDPQDPTEKDSAAEADYVRERGQQAVATLAGGFRSAGIDPEVSYVSGHDLAEAIMDQAERMQADLIVMGATRQLFEGEVWTSVTARVVMECERPLLLMPSRPPEETKQP